MKKNYAENKAIFSAIRIIRQAILTRETALKDFAVAEKYDLLVISDEIYDRLVYNADHVCFFFFAEC